MAGGGPGSLSLKIPSLQVAAHSTQHHVQSGVPDYAVGASVPIGCL